MNQNLDFKLKKLKSLLDDNLIDIEEYNEKKSVLLNEFLDYKDQNVNISKIYHKVVFKERYQFFLIYFDFTIYINNQQYKLYHGSELSLELEEGVYKIHIKSTFRKVNFTLNVQSPALIELNWNRMWGNLEYTVYSENIATFKNQSYITRNQNQHAIQNESISILLFLWYVIVPAWAIIFFFVYISQGKTLKAKQALLAVIVEILLVVIAVNFF